MSELRRDGRHDDHAWLCEQTLQRLLRDLLSRRDGDDTVRLDCAHDVTIYRLGQRRALISDEGLLTAAGRVFLAEIGGR